MGGSLGRTVQCVRPTGARCDSLAAHNTEWVYETVATKRECRFYPVSNGTLVAASKWPERSDPKWAQKTQALRAIQADSSQNRFSSPILQPKEGVRGGGTKGDAIPTAHNDWRVRDIGPVLQRHETALQHVAC